MLHGVVMGLGVVTLAALDLLVAMLRQGVH